MHVVFIVVNACIILLIVCLPGVMYTDAIFALNQKMYMYVLYTCKYTYRVLDFFLK